MGTLSLSLSGVATNFLVPMSLIETAFAQGSLLGNPGTPTVLLMGVKTSTGSATVDTTVYGPLGTEAEVVALFGAGSDHYVQWKAFTAVCKSAPMYGIAVTESVGTAATGTVTFVGVASGAGKVSYTIAGRLIEVAVTNGEAIADMAIALRDAINNYRPYLPVTATANLGVVTVLHRIKGTNGNHVRHRVTITSGITTTAAVNAAALATGATDEAYTTALASVLPTKYNYILPAINPTAGSDARFLALSSQIVTQALPTTGIRQQTILCTDATLADATTLVTAYNKARNQVMWQEAGEWLPMEVAAHFAGVRYNLETGADPGVSYDGYGRGVNDVWFVPAAYAQGDWPSLVEQNTALSVGLTPVASMTAGKSYVVMSCTAAGADPRIRDTCKVTVIDRFADDLGAVYDSQWARAKIADNQLDGERPYPANVATPDRVKYTTIHPLIVRYADASLVSDLTNTLAAVATGIDPTVVTRMNARIPLKVTSLAHQLCALVSEVSSG